MSRKIVVSGNIIEVWDYEKDLTINKRKDNKKPVGRTGQGIEDRKKEYKDTVNYRARQNIRRLILSNFTDKNLFITLTFEDNITLTEVTNKVFKQFIQRLKRKYRDLKYLSVIEFQKRGAIHYHMVCNYPVELLEGDNRREQELNFYKYLWGMGFVKIEDITGVDNVGAYLIKYLQKDFNRNFKEDKKRYLHSKNLIKPHIVDYEEFTGINEYVSTMYPVFTSQYDSMINGAVKYAEYNLLRGDTYKDGKS
jgi:hypothetical protein